MELNWITKEGNMGEENGQRGKKMKPCEGERMKCLGVLESWCEGRGYESESPWQG